MPHQSLGNGGAVARSAPGAPVQLFQQREPAEPIPREALGPLRQAVEAIAFYTQAPEAIAMQSVLGAASLATQPFRDVELLRGTSPISLFFLTVAESGERKSACDRLALRPVIAVEARRLRTYAEELRRFEDASKRAVAGDFNDHLVEDQRHLWHAAGPSQPPLHPGIRLSDATFEGLFQQLAIGTPSIGLMTDEGGQILGGHAMKRENKLRTAAGLSKLWDGASVDRRRASSPPAVLSGRRVTVHLMMQPGVATEAFGDPTFRDQGLLSRTLIAWPESRIGQRLIEIDDSNEARYAAALASLKPYEERMVELLETGFPTVNGSRQELAPRLLALGPDARAELARFYNRVELAQAPEGAFANLHGFASKAAEQAVRIAAVMTIFDDVYAPEIEQETMAGAIALMDWYLVEALRVLDAGYVSPELRDAERLREWLMSGHQGAVIDVRTAARCGPGRLRNADLLRRLFQKLEDYGWLRPCPTRAVMGGRVPARVWEIVRP